MDVSVTVNFFSNLYVHLHDCIMFAQVQVQNIFENL